MEGQQSSTPTIRYDYPTVVDWLTLFDGHHFDPCSSREVHLNYEIIRVLSPP